MKSVSVYSPSSLVDNKIIKHGTSSMPVPHDDWQSLVLTALACLRKEIGAISSVKKIAYHPKGQLLTVWTFVNDNSPKTLRSIYKKEQLMMDSFPELRFDFTIIFDSKKEPPAYFIIDFCN